MWSVWIGPVRRDRRLLQVPAATYTFPNERAATRFAVGTANEQRRVAHVISPSGQVVRKYLKGARAR